MRAVAIKKGQNREKAAGFPEMGTLPMKSPAFSATTKFNRP